MVTLIMIAADLLAIGILTGIYFRRHHRRDLVAAFLGVNAGVLAVSVVLADSAVGLGIGLGLFGVLSIIRLRSSEITQREVAYYFAALAMGLISGLSTVLSIIPFALMALLVAVMFVADHPRLLGTHRHQTMLLDTAHTNEAALTAELERRTGGRVTGVTVQHVDMVNDTTLVDVRYVLGGTPSNRGASLIDAHDDLLGATPAGRSRPMIASDFARLQAVGLDELVDTAALQTRVDRKYILDARAAEAVLSGVDLEARVLEITGRRAFAYESVYFDTPELLSYRMAATARRRRFKLRTRTYVDTRRSFLEVKTRGARATTVKDRIDYELARRDVLTDEGRDYASDALTAIGVERPAELSLHPTLATRYHRTTLLLPGGGGRGTIDTGLEWEDNAGTVLRRPDLVIVETKSASHISSLDRLLWSHGHRPATVSKYATGLAALRPDLPSNKWRPVLRRHFPHISAA